MEMSSNSGKSPVREKSRITEESLTKSELTKPPRSSFIGFLEGFQKKRGLRYEDEGQGGSRNLMILNLDPWALILQQVFPDLR